MKVYISHTGIEGWDNFIEICNASTLGELIDKMNDSGRFKKIYNIVFEGNSLSSSTRIFKNIDVIEDVRSYTFRYYENEHSKELRNINDSIDSSDSILISVFCAESLVNLLNESMKISSDCFNYKNEDGVDSKTDFKPMIYEIDFQTDLKLQTQYEFNDGEVTLEQLKYLSSEKPSIAYDLDGSFNKEDSHLLPEELIGAIRDIWGIDDGKGRLRLFQEDSLFFIGERLLIKNVEKEKQLLLSMPTGGGKTEAFMIPIISSIYQNKKEESEDRIKSIVIYPTNALANDQAMRFVELIYGVNKQLVQKGVSNEKLITIGILSGDTPYKTAHLAEESLIKICPECGKTKWKRKDEYLVCQNPDCGTNLSFCRLTKESILKSPPDILITNPDEVNMCLHNISMAKIFYKKIDSIVFDEIHVYQGIFGCHVAHLLRRLEEISNNKPLYIGMSATIKNAKELAALLFNEPLSNIKYINDKEHRYTNINKPSKQRMHILLKPALVAKKGDNAKYVRTMSVAGAAGIFIGHLLTDSHYRKSIIFTNYRSEADDLASYVRQRERLDIQLIFKSILDKYNRKEPLTNEEVEICQYMYKWFNSILSAIGTASTQLNVGWNRGGLEKETRIRSIHSFCRNNILGDGTDKYPIDLMIATKSLEVGIDIGDVTTVINASAPFTANEYVQRVGRGGRKKDSLAITIINPENAIDSYFKQHFSEYVEAKDNVFEEAPIILNNEIIIKRHIRARLIDHIVKLMVNDNSTAWNIKCRDIVEKLKLTKDGKMLTLGEGKNNNDVHDFTCVIYSQIFESKIGEHNILDNFVNFLKNENEILNTKLYKVSKEDIIEEFNNILIEFNTKVQSRAKGKWELDEVLIAYNGKWSKLTPNLRGNGANVSLHIGNSEKETDVVSRQTAFNQMPPAMNDKQVITVHSGISTFKIDGIYKETDGIIEKKIRSVLRKNENIRMYFSSKIDAFPDPEDEDEFVDSFKVTVPNALTVSYFPSRFYCQTCRKGLVSGTDYNEVRFEQDGIYCYTCGDKVEQLHEVYFCPDCSGVFDPPVGKICINPDCPDYKRFYAQLKESGFRVKKEMYEHFHFRLTKDLEWECETCKCKANYSSTKSMIISNKKKRNFVDNVVRNWIKDDTPIGMAVKYKSLPELFGAGATNRNRESVFKCKNNRDHKKIKSIGVPRVRTISYSYIGNLQKSGDFLCKSIDNDVLSVEFKEGYVLQLATQFMRRYVTGSFGNSVNRLKMDDIFDLKKGFNSLGNYYESHLAWIKFSNKLDEFIENVKYRCDGNCKECTKFSIDKLDLGESMKPRMALEEYNFDSITGKPKKPDYRGKFCEKAQRNECTHLECYLCNEFDKNSFLRYLTVHTVKHSVLWALPKYAGVNVTDIKGEIYPNDRENNVDIVLVDNNEGGSGAIILVQRHWNEIWEFAKEITKLTKENEANILLNHYCIRNNADLCPYIASDFFDFLD